MADDNDILNNENGEIDIPPEKMEKANFDMKFQMAIIKLMLMDDTFCSQMTRYLAGDDRELREYQVFETEALHMVFRTIAQLFKENSVKPSPPAVRQRILDARWEKGVMVRKEDVLDAVEQIVNLQIPDDKYYRSRMTSFIKKIKVMKTLKILQEENKKDFEKVPGLMQARVDDISKVSFEAESLMTLKMVPALIKESAVSMGSAIPTGIKELDKDLHGGLPRDSLIVVLSGTNVGKSMFCISLGAQALKAVDNTGKNMGLKVLMIPLEGQKQESIMRFAACMADVEYGKLINDTLNDEERKKLEDTLAIYDETRLQVLNMLDFNVTVESLIAACAEKHKEFKFDVLIVDYGQLLGTVQETEGHRFTMAVVFRGLSALARKFNCTVISPAQATRQGQENLTESNPRADKTKLPVLRSADISEAFEIARVAAVILSLNMTDEERAEKKVRVFLEKQRHGVKDKTYGLITNYARCNLITGQFYNPRSNIMDINAVVGQMATESANSGNGQAPSEPAPQAFSLQSWFSDSLSLDDLAKRERLSSILDFITDKREKQKAKIKEMQDAKEEDPITFEEPDSIYSSLRAEYEKTEEEIKTSLKEFVDLFKTSYPGAKAADIPVLQSALAKMKEQKAKEPELKKVEKTIARFEFRFNDVEVKELE